MINTKVFCPLGALLKQHCLTFIISSQDRIAKFGTNIVKYLMCSHNGNVLFSKSIIPKQTKTQDPCYNGVASKHELK